MSSCVLWYLIGRIFLQEQSCKNEFNVLLQNFIIPVYNYKKIIFSWIIRPVEFSAKCLSNGFPHTGLPHPWGSYKAQNGALQGILQLPNSQVLNHSLFQFIQSVMIGVQIFPALKEGQLLTKLCTQNQYKLFCIFAP